MNVAHPAHASQSPIRRRCRRSERRRGDRRCLPYRLSAYDQRTLDLVGQVVDIGGRGLKMVVREKPPAGREQRIWLELPTWCSDEQGTVLLDVQSRWSHGLSGGTSCETGFEITDMTPEAAVGIEVLLSELR